MLLFIIKDDKKVDYTFMYFKTSHVIVYQIMTEKEVCLRKISKHLMLLFIGGLEARMQLLADNFKTSHVIVYRVR